ncbi:MAG: type I polyketide synthase, partial [Planctomycetota bacterium]
HLMLSPATYVFLSRARALAADGRSKAFDAAADGFSRGEGCGVVVLKRLSDAQRDGDRIMAVIRGSAMNHDGASSGLTVPHGPAQEAVIAAALHQAGLQPQTVDYLEAHGTGTSLGDPIEVQAAAAVLGQGRDAAHPLLIGSVKTNIGHLEAAAGIAGLIKVVLSLQQGLIPRQLHFERPNPHIPWEQLPVKVVCEPAPWAYDGRPRIAGVSSFGMSGTNAHVIVEGPPEPVTLPAPRVPERTHHLLPLSAKSPEALQALAGRYLSWLDEHPQVKLGDVCYTASSGRSHMEHRAALVGESPARAQGLLQALARGASAPGLWLGRAARPAKVAWLFTGQGSQYAGMAQELYSTQMVFRQVLEECAALLANQRERPLLEVLFEDEDLLNDTSWTQPALFSLELALARLWQSWGVEPDLVAGHSLGQYTAACVAGVFSLEDGLRLVTARGRLLGALPSGGAMAAVFAPAERIEAAVAAHPALSIAAYNGAHTVVSGPVEAVEGVMAQFAAEAIRCQRLVTSHAFHSALVEPALEEFESLASRVQVHAAQRTLVCNLTGQALAADQLLDGVYWRRQAREPVQWAQSVRTLAELGCQVLLELGPQPVLTGMASACWPGEEPPVLAASLQRGQSDTQTLLKALAELYAQGVTPDFSAFDAPWQRQKLPLPTYPFQRQRYWVQPSPKRLVDAAQPVHPLLGVRQQLASGDVIYNQQFSCQADPWLSDHRVFEQVVAPGALYLSLALAISELPCGLREVSIPQAMLLDDQDNGGRQVQLVLEPAGEEGRQTFRLFSRDAAGDQGWTLHAGGQLQPGARPQDEDSAEPLETLRERLGEQSVEAFYEAGRAMGITYGESFQGLVGLWSAEGRALGSIHTPPQLPVEGLALHPAVLDACLQVTAAAVGDVSNGDATELYVPFEVQRLELLQPVPAHFYCQARLRETVGNNAETLTADLWLVDESDQLLGWITGLVLKHATRRAMLAAQTKIEDWLYEVQWQQQQSRAGEMVAADFFPTVASIAQQGAGSWLILTDRQGLGDQLAAWLSRQNQQCVFAELGAGYARMGADHYQVPLDDPAAWQRLLAEALPPESPLRGVVHLWSLDAVQTDSTASETLIQDTHRSCGSVLSLVQALVREDRRPTGGLWLVTRGAQVTGRQGAASLAQSPLWGLGQVVAMEHPELACRRIDLEASGSPDQLEPLLGELLAPDAEDQVALRGKGRLVPRLVRSPHLSDRLAL